jgi:hypothetical protein
MVTSGSASRRVTYSFAGFAAILVVAGFLAIQFAPRNAAPLAVPSPSPSASASPISSPSAAPMTVAAANALVRATVTGANPLVLPSAIPASWSAVVTNLTSSFFTVTYTSPDGAKEVDFAIVVPNPPPPGPHGSQVNPRFHGDKNSLYQVDDTTQPAGPRFLLWNEPGTWTEPNGLPGVPYFLATKGLIEAEFWATANSLVK